jgi:chitinase
MTTSTVYATSVYTVTSCAATVTDCPARLGHVTTETIALYTTVCPVSGSAAKPTTTAAPYGSYTSTIVKTLVYTVTSCAPTVTNCPAKVGKVTTELVTSTVVVPYTSTWLSVGASGTGAVKSTAAGTASPSITPVTGAASGLKAGSVLVLAFGAVVAMMI